MYRILVVDDEIWVRKGIINAIQWDRLQAELCGEAEDGDEAFGLACETLPDIIVMDMRMPGMDGKQLIRALNESLPDTVVIVVSGYSDFEYTKEAIVNRAYDYILKPIKKPELNIVLEKAAAEASRRRLSRLEKARHAVGTAIGKESMIKGLVLSPDGEKLVENGANELIGDILAGTEEVVCVCSLDNYSCFIERPVDEKDALLTARDFIDGHLTRYGCKKEVFINEAAGNEIVIVFFGDLMERGKMEAAFRSLITDGLDKSTNGISIGLGSIVRSWRDLNISYRQAVKALKMKKISESCSLIFFSELPDDTSASYPTEKENAFLYTLQTGDNRESMKTFNELLGLMCSGNATVYSVQRGLLILLGSIEKILNSFNASIEIVYGKSSMTLTSDILSLYNIDSMRYLFNMILEKTAGYFLTQNKKDGRKIIDEIVRSLNDNYFNQISLNDYANKYHLNPNYLSRLFKEETGRNFMDFLTDIRICKAKELLRNTLGKNYEISRMVGYEDYRYFSQVFRRVTGMTPGEYRENLQK